MKSTRLGLVAALVLAPALLLWAETAAAQKSYPLTGKIISNRGVFIRIPLLGNTVNNCTGIFPKGYRYGYLNPGTRMQVFSRTSTPPAGPYGCVSINGTLVTSADPRGQGNTFTVPDSVFNRPFNNYTVAASVPNQPQILQLATQFRIYGPPTDRPTTGDDSVGFVAMDHMVPFAMTTTLGPTQYTGTPSNNNLAPLRKLLKNAHSGQTGRAGASFTWCYPPAVGPACNFTSNPPTTPAQFGGGQYLFVKVSNANANKFGGTMNYLIETGSLPSSLAVGTAPSGPVELLGLAGMGHQPTGRGYADLLTDKIMTGDAWLMHMEMIVTPPQFGGLQFTLITMVTGIDLIGMGNITAATNKNFGFPWTTGTAIVKQTGQTLGQPMSATFTGTGADTTSTTAGGAMARNLTLVAPQVARTNIGAGTNTAGLGFMSLTLPEPGGAAQLAAGALALAAMAAWRSRQRS